MTTVVEQRFHGGQPLAMPPGLLTPLPWPDWSARLRSLDVDGARADYVVLGPYRLEVPPLVDRVEEPVRLMLVVVLHGVSTGTVDGHPLTLTSREAAIIDGRAAMRFEALAPVRALRLLVDEDHLSPAVLRSSSLPFARLKPTPLVAGCIGLITGMLQMDSAEVQPHEEVAVSRPLIALLESLLDEALLEGADTSAAMPAPESSALGRRGQIEAYIDEHFMDPRLDIALIASALGVTVRTVHAAFDTSPDTVAGAIRARRLVAAQTLLASRRDPPHIASLAERVGLSREQLTRLFRSATGLTARQWWEQQHTRRASPR